MANSHVRWDWVLTAANTDRSGQSHGDGRRQQQRCVNGIVGDTRQQQSDRCQWWQAPSGRQQVSHALERKLARHAEVASQRCLVQGTIDEVLPQQADQPLEAALACDILQIMAAQDQHACVAIDLAQHGLRRDHIFQAVGNIACLATRHVRPPWLIDAAMAYIRKTIVNLDQLNQYASR